MRLTGQPRSMMFAIKAEIADVDVDCFAFAAAKTMYGGKRIAEGDTIFLFASENEGGAGLIAAGIVTSAEAVPLKRGVARQTPRVNLVVRRTSTSTRSLGRRELKSFTQWDDGRPETELNFKFYRQATNKVVGLSDAAASFLLRYCSRRGGDMKGGKKGRPAKSGSAARKGSGGKLKLTPAKRSPAAAPRKGSPKRPDYGGASSKDEL